MRRRLLCGAIGLLLTASVLGAKRPPNAGLVDVYPVVPEAADEDARVLRWVDTLLERGNVREAERQLQDVLMRDPATLQSVNEGDGSYVVNVWSLLHGWVGQREDLRDWQATTLRHKAQSAVDAALTLDGDARERALVTASPRFQGLVPSAEAAIHVAALRLEAGLLVDAQVMLDRADLVVSRLSSDAERARFNDRLVSLHQVLLEADAAGSAPPPAAPLPDRLEQAWSIPYHNTDRRPTSDDVKPRRYDPNITAWGNRFDEHVVIHTKAAVFRLDPADGKEVWRFSWDAEAAGVPELWNRWHQPDQRRATPSPDGTALFAVMGPTTTFTPNTKPASNALVRLNAEDGGLAWDVRGQANPGDEWLGWFYAGTPVVWRDRVVAAMVCRTPDGRRINKIVVHDAATGAILQDTEISVARSVRRTSAGGALPTLGVIGDRLIVNDGVGLAAGVDLTSGQLLWARRMPDVKHPHDPLEHIRHFRHHSMMIRPVAEPTAFQDGVLINSPSEKRNHFLLDPDTGRMLREGAVTPHVYQSIPDGRGALTFGHHITRIAPDGQRMWRHGVLQIPELRHRRAARWRDGVVACGRKQTVLLDLADGSVLATIKRGPATPIGAGETLILIDKQRITGYRAASPADAESPADTAKADE